MTKKMPPDGLFRYYAPQPESRARRLNDWLGEYDQLATKLIALAAVLVAVLALV